MRALFSSFLLLLTRSPSANDVMTYINLIYLGVITERVPVVAMFTPSHIAPAPIIYFGEVFDVPRFIQESKVPLLEWDELKDPNSEVVDDLGCWNIWEAVQYYEHFPRRSSVPDWLNLGKLPSSNRVSVC